METNLATNGVFGVCLLFFCGLMLLEQYYTSQFLGGGCCDFFSLGAGKEGTTG
jgi:hypothetical protein